MKKNKELNIFRSFRISFGIAVCVHVCCKNWPQMHTLLRLLLLHLAAATAKFCMFLESESAVQKCAKKSFAKGVEECKRS